MTRGPRNRGEDEKLATDVVIDFVFVDVRASAGVLNLLLIVGTFAFTVLSFKEKEVIS